MNERAEALKAFLYLFAGGFFFSGKAILVKLVYRHEVGAHTSLALRMLFALPFYLWFFYKSSLWKKNVGLNEYLMVFLTGICGYYLASLFDFLGLLYISAGFERLILFIYPTIVLLISLIFLKKQPAKIQLFALVITYAGIFVSYFSELTISGDNTLTGALLIAASAFTYALYILGSEKYIRKWGINAFTSFAMLCATAAIFIHFLVKSDITALNVPAEVYGLSIIMAVLGTVLPSYLVGKGISLAGATQASLIGTVGPVITIFLAYFILNEPITISRLSGTFLVLAGVLSVTLFKKT